jgi:hypothetical protein
MSQSRSACRPSDRCGRRGQPQAHRHGAENRRLAPAPARQVVLLVEDQQAEARAHLVHVDIRAVVGGHRDRADVEGRIPDDPGVIPERRENPPMPLVHQVPHGRHDERRHAGFGHRGKGDFGLAGPGRHDDLPAPAPADPGVERLLLLGPGLGQVRLRPRDPHRRRDQILKVGPEPPAQGDLHGAIVDRVASPRSNASIPPPHGILRRRELARLRPGQQERPVVE